MGAVNGIPMEVGGLVWRSAPARGIHLLEIAPGAEWTARCAEAPADTAPPDGAARLLAAHARESSRACLTRLVLSAPPVERLSGVPGCAGLGAFSTRSAEGFALGAAAQLGVSETNLAFAASGELALHFPAGERLEALREAAAAPERTAPEGALHLGLRAATAGGFLKTGALCLPALGCEAWVAATDAAVSRGVLEGLLDRIWLAGPGALRAASGGYAPGSTLTLIATGRSGGAGAVTSDEDPELPAIAAGLVAAAALLARSRALADGRIPARIDGAASDAEAAGVARRLGPALARLAQDLARRERAEWPARMREALWAGLLTAPAPGLERAPVVVTAGGVTVLCGSESLPGMGRSAADAGDDARRCDAIGAWLDARAALTVSLGRGRAEAPLWI